MADKEDITNRLKKTVSEQLGVSEDDVQTTSNFIDDLGADSLDQVELIMAIEDEFELEIPDEVAENLTTVQEVITYVDGMLKD